MKRLADYTNEELLALTEEQQKRLVELECAYQGIIITPDPILQPVPEINIEPTIEAYEIFGLIFLRSEEAVAVSKMAVMTTARNYNINSSKEWLEPKINNYNEGMKPRKFYNKTDLDKVTNLIKAQSRIEKENETALKEYKTAHEAVEKIELALYYAIHLAKIEAEEMRRAKEVYAKHLDLAEGNATIAEKFFRDAYKGREGIINKIFPVTKTEEE
jgi:hypothetical protein